MTRTEARLAPQFIALNFKLANEKIRDDFLVFAAGMRIKYGIEQSIYHLRSAIKYGSPFFGYFLWRSKESDWCACTIAHSNKQI